MCMFDWCGIMPLLTIYRYYEYLTKSMKKSSVFFIMRIESFKFIHFGFIFNSLMNNHFAIKNKIPQLLHELNH